jgi:hypothetical protein
VSEGHYAGENCKQLSGNVDETNQLLNKNVPHGVGVAQLLPVLGVLSFCHCLCSLCGDETYVIDGNVPVKKLDMCQPYVQEPCG